MNEIEHQLNFLAVAAKEKFTRLECFPRTRIHVSRKH